MRDSGLGHHLLGIDSAKALLEHPRIGASWEGFVIEQILLDEPVVIYPGTQRRPIAEEVEAVPLAQLAAPDGLSAYLP